MDGADFEIIPGRRYTYTAAEPHGCTGHVYKVLGMATYVPVYQRVVVVRCLSGPDRGMLIVCSASNFSMRYRLAVDDPTPAPPRSDLAK